MKKLLILSFLALPILFSTNLYGKKKNKKKVIPATQLTPAIPVLTTELDSISYLFGIAMTQDLTDYFTQTGILSDTTQIAAEYRSKINATLDEGQKKEFISERNNTLDSITKKNNDAINALIEGFNTSFLAPKEKINYLQGVTMGAQISANTDRFSSEVLSAGDSINKSIFASAFTSILMGNEPLLKVENPQMEIQNIAQKLQSKKDEAEKEALKAKHQETIKAGEDFLTKNKERAEVTTLPSGLQYEILKMGEGKKASANDIVTVHYQGTLIDGTKFDSSYDRGEPTSFAVNHVIPGWTEVLQLIPQGSKWKVYIPYNLAYGERDQGTIKPFSTLIFEVELINVMSVEEANNIKK